MAQSTLGRLAVQEDIYAIMEDQRREDIQVKLGTGNAPLATIVNGLAESSTSRRETVGNEIEKVRGKIAGLTPKQAADFERYCETSVPESLKKIKDRSTSPWNRAWVSWLSGQAKDGQVLNFLQWHTHTIEQLASKPAVAKEIGRQKAQYKRAVVRGVDEGWLHPDAQKAEADVDDIKVRVGDLLDTIFQGRGGYAPSNSKDVVVASVASVPANGKYTRIIADVRRLQKHELNHAVLGGFPERWLNEALTEHIAQVMENGKIKVLSPNSRPRGGSSYTNERYLLGQVLSYGTISIPVSMATRAYSERGDSGEERSAFIEAINKSWSHVTPEGESAYDNLNAYIRSLEQKLMNEEGLTPIEAGGVAAAIVSRRFRKYAKLMGENEHRINAEDHLRDIFAGTKELATA